MDEDLSRALALHRSGNIDEAERIYLHLYKKNENNSNLCQLLGTIYLQKKNFQLSEKYLLKSLENDPVNPGTLNNLGLLHKEIKKIDKSLEYFEKNIEKNNFLNSWVNKSNILLENGRFNEGLEFTKKGLSKYPKDKKLTNNYAIFLFKCGFYNESLKIYKNFDTQNLHFPNSYINYVNILIETNNYSDALIIVNKLLSIFKNNTDGLKQRHLLYKLTNNYSKAEEDLLTLVNLDNSNLLSKKMLVEFYVDTKQYDKAILICNSMIERNLEKIFFTTKRILCKINTGYWNEFEKDLIFFNQNINSQLGNLNPLSLKYFNDDPLYQKNFSEKYWINKPKNNYLSMINPPDNQKNINSKIKIGYFSGDFRNHAVFHLIQDLFVNHNKLQFEIYAFSSFKKTGLEREKIIKYVDNFFDLDGLSDDEIIKFVKSHNLDIAVDLSGYTVHNKSHLFEHEISKIKINYLGYPGTMGTNKYDYIIADKYLIPEKDHEFYSEKVIYLPETYQPFTPKIFDMNIKRSEFNLPEKSFIMGCFSRIEKIQPHIFDIWMNIINKYTNINLALCINDENVKKNLFSYCKKKSFKYENIIFLSTIKHEDNLRRISTFDLYLDTFPYNGHTGISDSLFQSCVPTISYTGKSFASRVSLSLLNTIKLPELVTFNDKEYFEKIDYYYTNKDQLKKIKKYLLNYKNNNTNRMKGFTIDFEKLIVSIFLKYNKKINV